MLETQRLIIRRFHSRDWRDLYEYLSDPEVVRYEPYDVFTERESKKEARQRAGHKSFWAVCLKDSGKLIGNLYLDEQQHGNWELGYVFSRIFQKQGYALESSAALLDYAFIKQRARRIVAHCNTENTSSWRLLERLGMRREGHFIESASFKFGHDCRPIWHSAYGYAILAEEWSKKRGTIHFSPSGPGVAVRQVEDAAEKESITRSVMYALPKWFSPPQDIERKALLHRELPFFAAYADNRPIGFAALKQQNPYTADLFYLGVLEEFHRQGVGRRILQSCEDYCRQCNLRYLTVKTLDSSANYGPYERTRAFYNRVGFLPLEVIPQYWNEESPCLFLVKCLHP